MSATDFLRFAGSMVGSVSVPRRGPSRAQHFYIPPDPLPEGLPGDVLEAEPMHVYVVPGVRLRARAWRVMYLSTRATGEPVAVTGTVLLPPGPTNRVRPLIGFAVGTHGIGDFAAPSRLLARGLDWEGGLIAMILAHGWAVAVTDYEGLGTPGDHVYMVGRALGANVLDCMRAARVLHPGVLPADGQAAVIGYSEGGHAAAWAAQLQPSYAPEVELVGVAAGAAPADLEAAAPLLGGSFFSFFVAYGGIGYAAAYSELELDPYLTDRARAGIGFLRGSSVLEAAVRGPHFTHPHHLTQPNVFEMPQWRARMRENRLGDVAPAAPVLLHHARRDQIVSFKQSLDLRDDWLEQGADVRLYITRGGLDHISGAVAGTPVALEWLGRRLGGRARAGEPQAVPVAGGRMERAA
jgi:hypothetical protein